MSNDEKEIEIHSMVDMAQDYAAHCQQSEERCLDLGKWIPSLGNKIRPLVPGELCFFMAGTGVGKSMILQNIAIACRETTLFFELELPRTLMFERFMASAHKLDCKTVENTFKDGKYLSTSMLQSVFVVDASRISANKMEGIIMKQAREKIGDSPLIVMVDYIGLMASTGKSRYERTSVAAEDLKVMAKNTNTIVIASTQVSRPGGEDEADNNEVHIHSAKDSGSIENSCGLLIGAWRDRSEPHKHMWLRILKNTKGRSGDTIKCLIDGSKMLITEAPFEPGYNTQSTGSCEIYG